MTQGLWSVWGPHKLPDFRFCGDGTLFSLSTTKSPDLSWLIIGIEILSPIRFFWVLQSQYFISHTLAARAWIVLCFLQCVIFITLKRGFSGITGRNALTAVCRDRRRSTLRNTSTVKTLGERNESERTVCVALLLQCGLGCRLCQALYPSLYAHSLTPSASSSQRTCHTHTHTTHTHKILCTAVHTSSYKF